jgi:hypothetical protein
VAGQSGQCVVRCGISSPGVQGDARRCRVAVRAQWRHHRRPARQLAAPRCVRIHRPGDQRHRPLRTVAGGSPRTVQRLRWHDVRLAVRPLRLHAARGVARQHRHRLPRADPGAAALRGYFPAAAGSRPRTGTGAIGYVPRGRQGGKPARRGETGAGEVAQRDARPGARAADRLERERRCVLHQDHQPHQPVVEHPGQHPGGQRVPARQRRRCELPVHPLLHQCRRYADTRYRLRQPVRVRLRQRRSPEHHRWAGHTTRTKWRR